MQEEIILLRALSSRTEAQLRVGFRGEEHCFTDFVSVYPR
jgi:hypothetical protein